MQTSTKTVLITGAARRIGASLARYLHAHGFNIIIHYHRSGQEALSLALELNQIREDSAITLEADLNNGAQRRMLVTEAIEYWRRLDVLINNASQFYPTPLDEVSPEIWDDILSSNLKAPFFLAQLAATELIKQKGCIINITDIHAQRPLKDYPIYSIAKAGLAMLTQALAKELAPNVRVNAIAPGPILAPEGENSLSQEKQRALLERTALKRWGDPKEIAKAAYYLIHAHYVTGQVLVVDGGRTLNL